MIESCIHTRPVRSTTSYDLPDFVQRGYYQDRPFRCKDCGIEEIWTVVVRCRACRQSERARQTEARRIHREGLAMKQECRMPADPA